MEEVIQMFLLAAIVGGLAYSCSVVETNSGLTARYKICIEKATNVEQCKTERKE
jgi:hypothetical protein